MYYGTIPRLEGLYFSGFKVCIEKKRTDLNFLNYRQKEMVSLEVRVLVINNNMLLIKVNKPTSFMESLAPFKVRT